jgi:hypothetical protein
VIAIGCLTEKFFMLVQQRVPMFHLNQIRYCMWVGNETLSTLLLLVRWTCARRRNKEFDTKSIMNLKPDCILDRAMKNDHNSLPAK